MACVRISYGVEPIVPLVPVSRHNDDVSQLLREIGFEGERGREVGEGPNAQ